MKKMTYSIMCVSSLLIFSACGGGSSSKTVEVTGTATATTTETNTSSTETSTTDTKTRALNIITEYARTNGASATPVAQTYAYAGVVGVGVDNVGEFNDVVSGETAEEVDTTEELQVLLDAMGASTEPVAPIGPVELAPGVDVPDSLFPDVPGIPTGPTIPVRPRVPTIPTVPVPLVPGI